MPLVLGHIYTKLTLFTRYATRRKVPGPHYPGLLASILVRYLDTGVNYVFCAEVYSKGSGVEQSDCAGLRVSSPGCAVFLWIVALVIALFSGDIQLRAEPANVLVGDITFTRPEKWRWQPVPPKTAGQTSFAVPAESGGETSAIVLLGVAKKGPSAAFKAWRKRFPDPLKTNESEPEKKTISKRWVAYVQITGPYAFAGENHKKRMLLGAVVPSAGKFVHILMIGPPQTVRKATAEFKTFIETALQEME